MEEFVLPFLYLLYSALEQVERFYLLSVDVLFYEDLELFVVFASASFEDMSFLML